MTERKLRRTVAGQVIEEALVADPTVATMTLARRLYAKAPALWGGLEGCRMAIRRIRGAAGERDRRKVPTTAVRTPKESEACRQWGSLLPPAEPSNWRWHDLPKGPKRWLIVADMHVPYHDFRALETCFKHADGNCDGVLILGDGPDAYQLSHWSRDPRRRKFSQELVAWCQVLDAFASLRPKPKKIVWKGGNHEYRLERYLYQKAPEIADLHPVPPGGGDADMPDHFSWASFCCLAARGIEWVPGNNPIRHRALSLIHGHEWGNRFSSPVNPARGAFLKAHDCVVEAHCHRPSYHDEPTLTGRPIACWSVGCLCDLHPEYKPLGQKWSHGFAYLNTGSKWTIENHKIINGTEVA